MAGATPYLRLVATVVGGWLMGRQAMAATSTAKGLDDSYLAAKCATARFYMEQILPTINGLVAQVQGTAGPLYSVPHTMLASR